MRTSIAFLVGAAFALLIAAAAFRGGQPLDSTFTYQGQLRNAGQLVNGAADVRFTLWDSDIQGGQVGAANQFLNYPLTDGRFALGLNFGAGAFAGDQRWVQVEFRSPAGVGQYLTLDPRDKINATPYALYALNGVESQWSYNSKAQALSTSVGKVGIGTSTPTAVLEVVGTGGDDAVKLPAGSIGPQEVAYPFSAVKQVEFSWLNGEPNSVEWQIEIPVSGVMVIQGCGKSTNAGPKVIRVDGVAIGEAIGPHSEEPRATWHFHKVLPISGGAHTLKIEIGGYAGGTPYVGCSGSFTLMFVKELLP